MEYSQSAQGLCQERAELELPSNSLLTGTRKWLLGSKLGVTCSALAEAAKKPELLEKKSSTKAFFNRSSFLNFPVPKSDPGAEFVVESCGWWRGEALVINDWALLAGPKAPRWLASISCQIVFGKGWICLSHTVSYVDVRQLPVRKRSAMAALGSARSNNPCCCVWWALNGATACWGLPVQDCGGVPVIAVLFQERRVQKEEYVFFINVLFVWTVAQYQKLSSLPSERSSSGGEGIWVCSIRAYQHKKQGSNMFCVWSGSGEKGNQPTNWNLHLPGIWRERWTENKVLSFPLQPFLEFWPRGQFTQTLCRVGWVELKRSSAYNLHHKRLWSG